MSIALMLVLGLISGVAGGMGLGGGTILIPALTIFLNVPQTSAQGVNLIVFLPMAVVAIIIHSKNGFIQTKDLIFLILPGIVFSVVGAMVSNLIPRQIVRIVFGCFLILIAIWQAVDIIIKLKNKK